ncbi:hypothetical protein [Actinophytocola sp.]|uniref:hypothetical protein n=1 Tax=Actinophytocola sp. TaxID=1872138 RepID=UPI002D7FCA7F|nr:hypothetical protein [Actinophytocola sp.]HET9142692.1 hypothetical protein [Actinophytocola sp.]
MKDLPAGINGSTVVHLPVKPGIAGLYLGNVVVPGRFEPHRVQGFAGRAQDTVGFSTGQLVREYGLDKIPGWGPTDAVYFLKFYASHTFPFRTSFGSNNREVAADMGVARVYPPPFLGTGYFPGENPMPEYVLTLIELPFAAELWVRDGAESERRLGRYRGRVFGWERSPDEPAFGEAAWFSPPVPLPPLVRRGFTARYQGADFDVDLAGPGKLLLHPMPGMAAPGDFIDNAGSPVKLVDHVEVDELTFVRTLCSWKGATFEILGRGPDGTVLHLVDEDFITARDLGLSEVDYRVWRTVVPAGELTDIRTSAQPVPVEGTLAASG